MKGLFDSQYGEEGQLHWQTLSLYIWACENWFKTGRLEKNVNLALKFSQVVWTFTFNTALKHECHTITLVRHQFLAFSDTFALVAIVHCVTWVHFFITSYIWQQIYPLLHNGSNADTSQQRQQLERNQEVICHVGFYMVAFVFMTWAHLFSGLPQMLWCNTAIINTFLLSCSAPNGRQRRANIGFTFTRCPKTRRQTKILKLLCVCSMWK